MRLGSRSVGGLAVALGLAGCPMNDDYYLEASRVSSGGEPSSDAGSGTFMAGAPAQAGSMTSVPSDGGAGGGAPMLNQSGARSTCVESGRERCDGRDNDCDGDVDEAVCAEGCHGFVLEGQPDHGYAYCDATAAKTWQMARDACVADGMRLLRLESEVENNAVSDKLAALGDDAEIALGANDLEDEGDWRWGPSEPFWAGDEDGEPIGDAFTAWTEGVPNDENGGEDCGVLYPETATWGDRSCDQPFPYACEQLE
jgi:hypothetical protein